MTLNINIDTGMIRLTVNDDPGRIIQFNPSDVIFAEKFYAMMVEYQEKLKEFSDQAKVLQDRMNEEGFDAMGAMISLTKTVCDYTRQRIDHAFGQGTSQNLFGDTLSVYMFDSFFDGILPYFEKARDEKVQQYRKQVVEEKKKKLSK